MGAETLINVGAVVGVLPVTGIPLPFISFGGSSLVITMAAAGVLINVARQGEADGRRCGSPGRTGRSGPLRPGSVSARRGTVIAGGGTGGHIVPSLQIARALVERGPRAGHHRALRLAPGAGGDARGRRSSSRYTLLPGRGIRRSMRPSAWWANVGRRRSDWCGPAPAPWARFVARRPRVVVIVGGYASFPAGLAAVLTRVPLVSVNTDAVPGAVNGLLGRFAAANAVAFPGTDLPRAHVTGTPVRPELAVARPDPRGPGAAAAPHSACPPDRQTVAAVGGSLGALRINRAVAELAGTWAELSRAVRCTT